jgi:hypothetical protein
VPASLKNLIGLKLLIHSDISIACHGVIWMTTKNVSMDQCTLKNANKYLNTNIFYLFETPGGQSSNLIYKAQNIYIYIYVRTL